MPTIVGGRRNAAFSVYFTLFGGSAGISARGHTPRAECTLAHPLRPGHEIANASRANQWSGAPSSARETNRREKIFARSAGDILRMAVVDLPRVERPGALS